MDDLFRFFVASPCQAGCVYRKLDSAMIVVEAQCGLPKSMVSTGGIRKKNSGELGGGRKLRPRPPTA